jgi:hypothetical protein
VEEINMPSEIGPPKGISYTILSSKEITRATPACGYNDLGVVPNEGVFKVELRKYEEWIDQKLARTWTEKKEEFLRCR